MTTIKRITIQRLRQLIKNINITDTEEEFKTGDWEIITEDGIKHPMSDDIVNDIKIYRHYKEKINGWISNNP